MFKQKRLFLYGKDIREISRRRILMTNSLHSLLKNFRPTSLGVNKLLIYLNTRNQWLFGGQLKSIRLKTEGTITISNLILFLLLNKSLISYFRADPKSAIWASRIKSNWSLNQLILSIHLARNHCMILMRIIESRDRQLSFAFETHKKY